MEQTVIYLLMVYKIKIKAKGSEIVAVPLCLVPLYFKRPFCR